MKAGIMDLHKWMEKTAQAVRHICSQKQAPCVGFSLRFFDPTASPEERWSYVSELAFDPHNPPSDDEREQVRQTFEFISEGVRHIMGGESVLNSVDGQIETLPCTERKKRAISSCPAHPCPVPLFSEIPSIT
ncbi:MAG: hypothetical protein JSU72_09530 [Deltaproteobacteria bacterium]|nr:MAG: hypothetical protein JSU72_09530 [Deltaproteobacteria bacterium]